MASHEGSPVRPRRRVTSRQVIALVIIVLVVVFVFQNRDPVQIRFFAATFISPLWLLLVIMAAVGVLAGFLFARRRS